MKILFSPSESKKPTPNPLKSVLMAINCDRDEILNRYYEILNSKDERVLSEIFGIKESKEIDKIANLSILGHLIR